MGLLIPTTLVKPVPPTVASVESLDDMFLWYNKRKGDASVEGLSTITSNIAVAFSDFILRICSNISVSVTGAFKDVKRSALQSLMASNKHGMMRVMKADYSDIVSVSCSLYPFTKSPIIMAGYFNDTFAVISMSKRMVSLIENYNHLSAAIKIGDLTKASGIIAAINDMNISNTLHIKDRLIEMVAIPEDTNRTSFGLIFDSVSEYSESIMTTLVSANELDAAVKIGHMLNTLYGAWESLKTSIAHVASSNIDLSSLSPIAGTVHATGELLESYALLIKEYHHLEWWLATTSEALLEHLKK